MSANVRNLDLEPTARPRAGRWWALAALVVSGLVIGLDTTVLVTALPTLSQKLGATTSDLQWITAAYTLALGGLLLPGGVLGDRFGRKLLLMVGLVVFGISSVAAGQMTTATGLIAMRALMGIGAALVLPLSLSILPSLFSEAERPRAVSAAAAGAFLGLPLGPVVAGWLLTHYAWGSVFLINAPVVVIGVIGVWFLVPESKDPHPQAFDWFGGLLAVVGVTALVYGVIEQPIHGWGDSRVLIGIIGGAIVLVAFIIWDLRRPAPFVDLRNFRNRSFTWSTVAFVMTGFALFGVMFILTPYIQIVLGNDAQATGIKLLPMIGGVIVGAGIGNVLAARLGARVGVSFGLLVGAAGLVIFSRAGSDTGYGLVAAALAVVGVGIGVALPTTLDIILGVLPPDQTGAGSALTRALQQVAASFGVAILGSLLSNVYQNNLGPHVGALPATARELAQGSIAGAVAVAAHLPPAVGGPLARAAKDAYTAGVAEVMIVSAALMVLTAIAIALFLPSRVTKTQDGKLS
ncbi:MAG TPA: DHA2 family efflux MFS transporter permease subunit [Candidatus Dormibacteraeota bacterium]|nr:DHA2 family efflux MFS transporter permease subunit [Candidatus Dormibacteraeota bacterium]